MQKKKSDALAVFQKQVINKFNLYNGLFTQLPYEKMANIAHLLPFLSAQSKQGLEEGKTPKEIIHGFFERYTELDTVEDRNSFLFRIIQYVERQVVLFDSIEDASFNLLKNAEESTSIEDLVKVLVAQGKRNELIHFLNSFSVRIVFTAHPTQFYPPAVQHIIHDLDDAMQRGEVEDIDLLLQQLGQTPFVNREKPSPLDEAKSIIYYLRNVYYKAMGDMIYDLQQFPALHHKFDNHGLIQLGFWPGGDRDGNPFVTYDITRRVADELRTTLMKCYYNELKYIRRRITFRAADEILQQLSDRLYSAMFDTEVSIAYQDILGPLESIRSLVDSAYHDLFIDLLDKLIVRVKIFKTHFAAIDIRQDSTIHHQVISEIVAQEQWSDKPWSNMNNDERMEVFARIKEPIDTSKYAGITAETLQNVKQLKFIQTKNGEAGCNRYIISNSEDIWAVLHVYMLFRMVGYQNEEIDFDIVPLFETMKGMEASGEVMDFLYNFEIYRAHLGRRKMCQTIMLGFSDGTKDGGYLKANWEIYHTKESLTTVSRAHGVEAIYFDGRGGPPARGGGKTHKFYASQGKHISNKEIQLTIQGQTITSMYGNVSQFSHNCEQLVSAGIINELFDFEDTKLGLKQRELIEELGRYSFEKYAALKSHEMFLPYLEEISTLKYYGKANIGSRPGKRGNKDKLEFSDLRAISFVGSWSQLKQNVPGYFGIGTAIEQIKNQGRIQEIKDLFLNSAFFRALILNSMMAMQKTYFPLTSYMRQNPKFGTFWSILKEEYDKSVTMSLEIAGYHTLMEAEQLSKESILMRDKIVLPLLVIQQYALQCIAEGNDKDQVMSKMVTRSLFGNINASRNSA